VFANMILADEINRPLQNAGRYARKAMQERRVTDRQAFVLDSPFLVLATQIGRTKKALIHYPRAQLDRFMFLIELIIHRKKEIESGARRPRDDLPRSRICFTRPSHSYQISSDGAVPTTYISIRA